jgi:hypothetical protein
MNSDRPPTTAATNDGPSQVWTVERIRALGAVTDITTAGQIFPTPPTRAPPPNRRLDPAPESRVDHHHQIRSPARPAQAAAPTKGPNDG